MSLPKIELSPRHSITLQARADRTSRYSSIILWSLLFLPNLALAQSTPNPNTGIPPEPELSIDLTGERRRELPKSTPVYTINSTQIQQQGAKSVAEVLKNLPGFAINDTGFGADIHTGTYYRGASINQSIILLNGRPIGSNINIYHGGTDLNSIPVDEIDRIELSSGASNTALPVVMKYSSSN